MIEPTYYACLKYKNGYIEKKKFKTRDEARDYIAKNFDTEIHIQRWTE